MNAATAGLPRVAVLMATWNAQSFVELQASTILGQHGVQVHLFVSDDHSSDATPKLLENIRLAHPGAVTLLPTAAQRFGNANRNFLRLIRDCDVGPAQFVALADHDDVWLPNKLLQATACIADAGLDAYSSDVIAFWSNGLERRIRKSWPQRRFDHLFESAGPGCTFVLRRGAFDELRSWLQGQPGADDARVHDWLIYAFARSRGWRWLIDSRALVRYRQHSANEMGANVGWRAMRSRWQRIREGVFRHDALLMADLVGDTSWVSSALRRFTLHDRLKLLASARQLRRRPRDCLALACFMLVMSGRRE